MVGGGAGLVRLRAGGLPAVPASRRVQVPDRARGLSPPRTHHGGGPGGLRRPALDPCGAGGLPATGVREAPARGVLCRLSGRGAGAPHRQHAPLPGDRPATLALPGPAPHRLGARPRPHDLPQGPGHESALLLHFACHHVCGHGEAAVRGCGPRPVRRWSRGAVPTLPARATPGGHLARPVARPARPGLPDRTVALRLRRGGALRSGMGRGIPARGLGEHHYPRPGDRLYLLGHRRGARPGGCGGHRPPLPDLRAAGPAHRRTRPR